MAPYIHQPLSVAYSGGMDSHVLLHLLWRLREQHPFMQIGAVHVHHGLSPNADQWQSHCERVCQALGIALTSRRVKVLMKGRQSLEAQAREARYQAIDETVGTDTAVLLGQHQRDQLESFLLQLKRGAGPRGLSAMADSQRSGDRLYLRPLLQQPPSSLRQYAQEFALQWVEDESNLHTGFERNFLRHEIVPLLEARWPHIGSTVARSARLCAEQQTLLDECTSGHLARLRQKDGSLCLKGLVGFSPSWQRQIVRLWLLDAGLPVPTEKQLEQIIRQAMQAREDAAPSVKVANWQVRRFQQRLYLTGSIVNTMPEELIWRGEKVFVLPDGRRLEFTPGYKRGESNEILLNIAQEDSVAVCFARLNDRFTPAGSRHSKPLKQWLKLWRVPPWQRSQLPLIYLNQRLVAVLGLEGPELADTEGNKPGWLRIRLAGSGKTLPS